MSVSSSVQNQELGPEDAGRLLEIKTVSPDQFQIVFDRYNALVLQGYLPLEDDTALQLQNIRTTFASSPQSGCRELQKFISQQTNLKPDG